MSVKLIRLLAVAIALVVPIQGVAAVTAGICMAIGHHQDAAGHEDHAGQAQDGHDHATHSHDDEAGSKAAAAADKSDGQSAHCGPCAACCASASIAAASPASIAPSLADAPYVSSQLPPPGVQLDGFDRPPLAL